MTEEERFRELDRIANKAIKKIQDARDWIDSINKEFGTSKLSNDPSKWTSISEECDSLVEDIDFQLGQEAKHP